MRPGRGRFAPLGVYSRVDSIKPIPISAPARAWLPPKAIEPYVSRCELARLMGVSVATVDRMVADGMPSVTWGRRTRRFRPSVAIAWAAERGRAA
jgi:hypothetical protein